MAKRIAARAKKTPAKKLAVKAAAARRVPKPVPAKKAAAKRPQKPAPAPAAGGEGTGVSYPIILRTHGAGGTLNELRASAQDKVLYPLTVSWNRVLDAHEVRKNGWHGTSHKAFHEFAAKGGLDPRLIDPFIKAAATSGIVEVEMEWVSEDVGWAARLFPWEAMLSMATKAQRDLLQKPHFVVVRVLKRPNALPANNAANPAPDTVAYAPCEAGNSFAPLDFTAERDAISTSMGALTTLDTRSLPQLRQDVARIKPTIIHYAANDPGNGPIMASGPGGTPAAQPLEEVAAATAAHGPKLAVYSCCYSGRRLAPYAVVVGARVALGFQGDVFDDSVPLFFGPFYQEWKNSGDVTLALCKGLEAHNSQREAADLGGVTVWSDATLLKPDKVPAPAGNAQAAVALLRDEDLTDAFRVDFVPRGVFNYSVLHNDRSGLFQSFTLTKKPEGKTPFVDVTVTLKTGVGSDTTCQFSVLPGNRAFDFTNLAQRLSLPLGAPLIRQRGESLWATLETKVVCKDVVLHRESTPLSILPCDEWRDDAVGTHYLPSFVFPRNPAIREIISAAQPFLRSLADTPQAGFDGYQAAFARAQTDDDTSAAEKAVEYQVRAFWAALQHPLRLDYVNASATHTRQSQRLRTPDEVLRSRRGTCIELALLFASCLEHVGIHPVLFLVPGHAFAGYWTSDKAHQNFTANPDKILENALPDNAAKANLHPGNAQQNQPQQEQAQQNKAQQDKVSVFRWSYNAPHHPEALWEEVNQGRLVVVETTGIPFQNSFEDSKKSARKRLEATFIAPTNRTKLDAMLDVKVAREERVTPLPIVVDGIFA